MLGFLPIRAEAATTLKKSELSIGDTVNTNLRALANSSTGNMYIYTSEDVIIFNYNSRDLFSDLSNCQEIAFGKGKIDTSAVGYMTRLFKGMHSLKSIDLSEFKTPKVDSFSSMFCNCTSLKKLKTPKISAIATDLPLCFYYDDNNDGIPDSPTKIEAKACKGNSKIKALSLGKNVKAIGKEAFYGCKKLKSVAINANKSLKVGKGAFKKLSKGASIKIKGVKTKK